MKQTIQQNVEASSRNTQVLNNKKNALLLLKHMKMSPHIIVTLPKKMALQKSHSKTQQGQKNTKFLKTKPYPLRFPEIPE